MISREEKETTGRGQAISAKRVVLPGLLITLVFVSGYVESPVPVYLGTPGVELGLANLVITITLYYTGAKTAIAVNMMRIFLSEPTFGPASAIFFSLTGAAFGLTVMAVCREFRLFGVMGVSILEEVAHNIGQFLMAAFVVHASDMFSYLPVFLAAGIVAGTLIGPLGGMVVQWISHVIREIWYKC